MRTSVSSSRPEVAVNLALSWDGRVLGLNRLAPDISPRAAQRRMEIRANGDALLGDRTMLERETMDLGWPDEDLRAARVNRGERPCPIRVVVTNSGRLLPVLPFLDGELCPVVVFFSTERMPIETREALAARARVYCTDGPVVDLRAMLRTLWDTWAVRRLVCEGGPTLFRALLEEELVDELNVTFCPRIFGGQNAPTLTGCVGEFLQTTREFRLEASEVIDAECFLRYRARVR